jgi:phospholipid/cholesterol/gamma-HCH transport system substrate-binding protein
MRRLATIATVLAVVIAAVVVVTGQARSAGGTYTVRAIFDDASFAASGEDVRIAGANVGSITSLGVTSGKKAAVTITINDSRFAPFYANAHCAIRPQSLIGEEYVDCTPGTSHAKALSKINHGPGSGDFYLPVQRTSSPIDTDIVQNISTEPVRESLAVIINELGTGLAARGSDLNAVIHRANPALGNTDKVIKVLDRQDHTLANLATSSANVLGPLARERSQIAGFVNGANTTAVASARQAADIDATFRKFPSFLRQLRPLMADLGTLADQGTPVLKELGQAAAPLGNEFAELGPFAKTARTSLLNLGSATAKARPALVASQPLADQLLKAGTETKPAAQSLATLLTSLDNTGGIEQLMNVLYQGTSAANGFNSLGHYVRAEPITSGCTAYSITHLASCKANFTNGHQGPSSAGSKGSKGSSASSSAESAALTDASASTSAATASQSIVAQALKSVGDRAPDSTVSGLLGYLLGKTP